MSDRSAFYAAIRDEPDDDVPRLVFADWLEENGDADYAAFIRLQCIFDDLDRDPDERLAVQPQIDELWTANASRWQSRLPVFEGIEWAPFHRGFPESMFAQNWYDFLRHLPELWQHTPVAGLGIRTGRLRGERWDEEARIRRLAQPESLAPLRSLHIAEPDWLDGTLLERFRAGCFSGLHSLAFTGPSAIPAALVDSPEVLPNLRRLNLTTWSVRDSRWRISTERRPWPSLREINLSLGGLSHEATDLFQSTNFPVLQDLDLSMNRIDESFLKGVHSSTLTNLRRLDLGGNTIGDEGVFALANCRGLGELRELWLQNNGLSEMGMRAIAEAADWPHLRMINLSRNRFQDHGLRPLLGFGFPLRELRLESNLLSAAAMLTLTRWPGFTSVVDLDLSYNPIGDEGIQYLTQRTDPLALRTLMLREASIGPRGAARLAAWPITDQLVELDLQNNPLGSAGVRALFHSCNFSRLRVLSLNNCGITSSDVYVMMRHPQMPHLRALNLHNNSDIDFGTAEFLQDFLGDRVTI